jgi:hypothetical protein
LRRLCQSSCRPPHLHVKMLRFVHVEVETHMCLWIGSSTRAREARARLLYSCGGELHTLVLSIVWPALKVTLLVVVLVLEPVIWFPAAVNPQRNCSLENPWSSVITLVVRIYLAMAFLFAQFLYATELTAAVCGRVKRSRRKRRKPVNIYPLACLVSQRYTHTY